MTFEECNMRSPATLTTQDTALSRQQYTHVIALVNGIRDAGAWQDTVSRELSAPGVHVAQIRYAYHSAIRFLCPANLSKKPVSTVLRGLRNLRHEFPNAKLSIIAHSFGTYVIQQVLREDRTLRLWKLVFCGSVADDLTDWAEFSHRVGDGMRPTKDFIVNDCGTGDIWPVLGTAFGFRYGMAGVIGFSEEFVTNRFYRGPDHSPGRHSLYFNGDFVRNNWRPLLVDDSAPAPGNGIQGEHLPRLVKVFYWQAAQWCARAANLGIWGAAVALAMFIIIWCAINLPATAKLIRSTAVEQQLPSDEPVPAELRPAPATEPTFPPRARITEAGGRSLEGVMFRYRNDTDRSLRLLLYDCARHYQGHTDRNDTIVRSYFRDWPLPPRAPPNRQDYWRFSTFPKGSSWFGIYVFDLSTRRVHRVGFYDFTRSTEWTLIVREEAGQLKGELTYD
jgi:hypothetical protein